MTLEIDLLLLNTITILSIISTFNLICVQSQTTGYVFWMSVVTKSFEVCFIIRTMIHLSLSLYMLQTTSALWNADPPGLSLYLSFLFFFLFYNQNYYVMFLSINSWYILFALFRYIRRGQPDAGFPLFESESLKWPGFVEFDDVNGKVLTYSAQDRYISTQILLSFLMP